ncbi:MAG: hypothetical protein ACRECX_02070 [Methyloceanibacter sp.]|uniref:hypothetical protein n=1 Tax=Methyloceanibacter sp. TaxID=1965321 RepID=UPI003D6CF2BD
MDFTVGSAIRFGWETFKTRPWFFVGATVIMGIAYLVLGTLTTAIDTTTGGSAEEPTLLGTIVNIGLSTLINMGVTAFFLAAHHNPQGVEFSALWHPRPFWKFLGASILVGLTIGIGFLLLIVPGVIALLFFIFTTFIVIDRELGPIEAMKESMRITKGYRWPLLGFILVVALLMLAGALALLVGLLVAVPVTTLAFVHVYRVLSAKAGQIPPRVQDATLAP